MTFTVQTCYQSTYKIEFENLRQGDVHEISVEDVTLSINKKLEMTVRTKTRPIIVSCPERNWEETAQPDKEIGLKQLYAEGHRTLLIRFQDFVGSNLVQIVAERIGKATTTLKEVAAALDSSNVWQLSISDLENLQNRLASIRENVIEPLRAIGAGSDDYEQVVCKFDELTLKSETAIRRIKSLDLVGGNLEIFEDWIAKKKEPDTDSKKDATEEWVIGS